MKYLKTNHPDVIAACNQFYAEVAELELAGKKIADQFGGIAQFKHSIISIDFHGITFEPIKDDPLWTKPSQQAPHSQNPRSALRKGTTEQHEELKLLNERWKAAYKDAFPNPKSRVSREPVLKAIGTDWGRCLFNLIGYFMLDDHLYIHTTQTLNDTVIEITGSEFLAAQSIFNTRKKAGVPS